MIKMKKVEEKKDLTPEQLAEELGDMLNTFSTELKIIKFIRGMDKEHRTLQQNFTKLCLSWLQHLASLEDRQFDGRNEASVEISRDMLKAFCEEFDYSYENLVEEFDIHDNIKDVQYDLISRMLPTV